MTKMHLSRSCTTFYFPMQMWMRTLARTRDQSFSISQLAHMRWLIYYYLHALSFWLLSSLMRHLYILWLMIIVFISTRRTFQKCVDRAEYIIHVYMVYLEARDARLSMQIIIAILLPGLSTHSNLNNWLWNVLQYMVSLNECADADIIFVRFSSSGENGYVFDLELSFLAFIDGKCFSIVAVYVFVRTR